MTTEYARSYETRFDRLNGKSYDAYLRSREWFTVRARLRSRPGYDSCHACGSRRDIEMHHTTYAYIHTKDPARGVIPLCDDCHESVHAYARDFRLSIEKATSSYVSKLSGRPVIYEESLGFEGAGGAGFLEMLTKECQNVWIKEKTKDIPKRGKKKKRIRNKQCEFDRVDGGRCKAKARFTLDGKYICKQHLRLLRK